ncbi:MAG: hypothetical protein ABJN70_01115 [Parasphingorhabdus sp.]|uniref:hypothetical protein n=1 Tax=Parasphingorhabdus sp. TaxID=2709688 RepID=UPI003298FB2E
MIDWLLSILMIAGVALLAGGIFILRKGTNRKQGILMLIASAVMFGNLAIWLAPVPEGSDPIESR